MTRGNFENFVKITLPWCRAEHRKVEKKLSVGEHRKEEEK